MLRVRYSPFCTPAPPLLYTSCLFVSFSTPQAQKSFGKSNQLPIIGGYPVAAFAPARSHWPNTRTGVLEADVLREMLAFRRSVWHGGKMELFLAVAVGAF